MSHCNNQIKPEGMKKRNTRSGRASERKLGERGFWFERMRKKVEEIGLLKKGR
jgi:hypothetical protein